MLFMCHTDVSWLLELSFSTTVPAVLTPTIRHLYEAEEMQETKLGKIRFSFKSHSKI